MRMRRPPAPLQRRRTLLALGLVVAAALLVVVGVALVYLPWGLISAGVLLFGSLFLDFDALLASSRRKP